MFVIKILACPYFLPDELAKAIRRLTKPKVRFGLYYSLYEWFNPHYLKDKASGFKTDEYVRVSESHTITWFSRFVIVAMLVNENKTEISY